MSGYIFGNALANAAVAKLRSSGSTANDAANKQKQEQAKAQKNGATDIPLQSSEFGSDIDRIKQAYLDKQAQKDTKYTVKAGDSLSEISEALYGDAYLFTEIAATNGITDSNYGIQAGQELVIPNLMGLSSEGRSSLNQIGRSEIGRLGHEALDAIASFDYSSLYHNDFSINMGAVKSLTNYHK